MFLILGIQTRWVALALSPILIGAVWVHSGNGWLFASPDGGWEYPLYLFVLCVAQAMLGDGPYAISTSWLPGGRAGVKSRKAAPYTDFTNARSMRSTTHGQCWRLIWLVLDAGPTNLSLTARH